MGMQTHKSRHCKGGPKEVYVDAVLSELFGYFPSSNGPDLYVLWVGWPTIEAGGYPGHGIFTAKIGKVLGKPGWVHYCWVPGMGFQPSSVVPCPVPSGPHPGPQRQGPFGGQAGDLDQAEGGQPTGYDCETGARQMNIEWQVCLRKDRLQFVFRDPNQAEDSVGADSQEQKAMGWSNATGYRLKRSSANSLYDTGHITLLNLNVLIQNIRDAILASWDHCQDERFYIYIWHTVKYGHTESLNLCLFNPINIYRTLLWTRLCGRNWDTFSSYGNNQWCAHKCLTTSSLGEKLKTAL